MDLKNIIAAIALSAAVIVLYSLFFTPTQEEIDNLSQNENKKEEIINNMDAPSIEENVPDNVISRDDAIKESSRIFFENEFIKGSISLTGGAIDDLELKIYNQTLDSSKYYNDSVRNPGRIKF